MLNDDSVLIPGVMIGLNTLLLYLLYLINLCHGSWDYCGAAYIEDQDNCYCGNVTITEDNRRKNGEDCCGPDSCTLTEDGSAECPGGEKCDGSTTLPCGDMRISQFNKCHYFSKIP